MDNGKFIGSYNPSAEKADDLGGGAGMWMRQRTRPGREAGWHKAPALSGNREPWAAGPAQVLTCLGPWKVTGPHLAFVKDEMGVLD